MDQAFFSNHRYPYSAVLPGSHCSCLCVKTIHSLIVLLRPHLWRMHQSLWSWLTTWWIIIWETFLILRQCPADNRSTAPSRRRRLTMFQTLVVSISTSVLLLLIDRWQISKVVRDSVLHDWLKLRQTCKYIRATLTNVLRYFDPIQKRFYLELFVLRSLYAVQEMKLNSHLEVSAIQLFVAGTLSKFRLVVSHLAKKQRCYCLRTTTSIAHVIVINKCWVGVNRFWNMVQWKMMGLNSMPCSVRNAINIV